MLDRELDLYDHVVDVEFVERLRGMVAFTNIPDLIETMRGDVDRARDLADCGLQSGGSVGRRTPRGVRGAVRDRRSPRGTG